MDRRGQVSKHSMVPKLTKLYFTLLAAPGALHLDDITIITRGHGVRHTRILP